MAYGTANSYARPRRRRRKRKSHYGVLALVIVLLIALIVLAVKLVTTAVSTVLGRTETHEIVYQVDNKLGYCDGKTFDLEAAPYRDQSGNLFAPLQSLCDALQIDLTWDESTKSGTAVWNKQTAEIKASSTKVQMGEESRNMAAAPSVKDGVVFIPAKDFCAAFSWKTAETAEEQGDLLIISQKDDELTEDAIKQITDDVTKVLGPSEKQITGDSILMRTDSDKALVAGETKTMASDGEKLGEGVMEQNGTKYVPLKAAMTALGGTAEFDGKKTWTVKYNDTETTVTTNGKFKIDGNRVKGDDFTVWLDEEKDRFYVSAPALAQIIGRNYTDLGDGAFAFTTLSLDGLDSQKTYLDSLRSSLSDAVDGDIPEADVYIALTFDDGPTGKIENYPNRLHAVFHSNLSCGFRGGLRRERSTLSGASETQLTGARPRNSVALGVGDGHDRVVKGGLNMRGAAVNIFALTASAYGGFLAALLSCHQNPSLFLLVSYRLLGSLAGSGVGLGALASYGQALTVTDAAIATDFNKSLNIERHIPAKVALHAAVMVDILSQLGNIVLG